MNQPDQFDQVARDIVRKVLWPSESNLNIIKEAVAKALREAAREARVQELRSFVQAIQEEDPDAGLVWLSAIEERANEIEKGEGR